MRAQAPEKPCNVGCVHIAIALGEYAGERMLCMVQRYHLHLSRLLAMCLDAVLCRIMQRYSAQMQQLWKSGWQACLGQIAKQHSCCALPTGP